MLAESGYLLKQVKPQLTKNRRRVKQHHAAVAYKKSIRFP
ncbi:hypothetical protein [Limihaloglobus sulfuriphilus]